MKLIIIMFVKSYKMKLIRDLIRVNNRVINYK